MPAIPSPAREVATFEGFGRDLRWAGSCDSTGVHLNNTHDLDGEQRTRVALTGKDRHLLVDLARARADYAPVFLAGEVSPLAYLSAEPDIVATVTDVSWRGGLNRWSARWVEYPNVETALVDLAYEYCT
jgi:hypothetical protein